MIQPKKFKKLRVRNPLTGEIDYHFNTPSLSELVQRIRSLRQHQVNWQECLLMHRIEVLRQWQQTLEKQQKDIINALTTDTGRRSLSTVEFTALIDSISKWCDLAPELLEPKDQKSTSMPEVEILCNYKPFPLLGAISPWNFPLLLSFIDVIPALLAGSAAFIKPSEITPRFAEPIAKTIEDVPDLSMVLTIKPGGSALGQELVRQVDIIAFTGSVPTGKKVAQAAAKEFIPAYLELGGKDPAIVLQGSDLDRASTAILRASIAATGQACQSIERIYVSEIDYLAFLQILKKKAEEAAETLGDPSRDIIGPLIFKNQAKVISDHIADAISKGAVIECGGTIENRQGGLWIAPTVLSKVNHRMKVMTEETFGPLMPVMSYKTEEEAIAMANDTTYGLSAAVFGPSEASAIAVAGRINAGGITVNDAGLTAFLSETEKMGFGYSGMGPSRVGRSGMTRFLQTRSTFINRGGVMPISVLG
jgi:succinate-semialdehyde dehydrogenase/glutarate-semialdehyde dehydrogenase